MYASPKTMSFAKAVAMPASLDTRQTYVPPLATFTLSIVRVDPSEIFVVPRNHSTVGVGIPTAAQ